MTRATTKKKKRTRLLFGIAIIELFRFIQWFIFGVGVGAVRWAQVCVCVQWISLPTFCSFLYAMELHTICVCLCARVCVPSSMRLTAHHAIIASLHFRLSNQFTHNFIVLHKMDIYTILWHRMSFSSSFHCLNIWYRTIFYTNKFH